VESWAGRGVYGAVYRAVPVAEAHADPVALKVALFPDDPRFAREVELLSRAHHPSLPELYGHGVWQASGGTLHPFLAMQWVAGLHLYDWARMHAPSPAQVLRLLAQLAGALHALHSLGCLHRDVKGENVLLRYPDSHAFLMDLGSGLHPGAATLTPPTVYPGTPAYRSPESWLFELQSRHRPSARYQAGPTDDLYALGVTACRLLTGEYPEPAAPTRDGHGAWRLPAVLIPPALANAAGWEPRLRTLVLRMLSVRPEERGTAEELAQALEQAAEHAASKHSQPLATEVPLTAPPLDKAAEVSASQPQQASSLPLQELPGAKSSLVATGSAKSVRPHVHARPAWPWLTLAAGMALAVWARWAAPDMPQEQLSIARAEATKAGPPDAGTAGLGAAASAISVEQAPHTPRQEVMAEDALPEPLPGQTRPDAKGRCPRKEQIPLNRGCWLEVSLDGEACEGNGGHFFKGKCYLPIILPKKERPPTSSPMEKPSGVAWPPSSGPRP
jgi:serine/threonine protein kinase